MSDHSSSGELIHQAVVPGSSSGVYYIPVSNLHPSMTFGDLRSVARKVASIEKCFVYPNVTEGWVRVRGYVNFKRAYRYLNGYKYNGCIISASGQNENNVVYIWDVRKSPHGIESTYSYLPADEGQGGNGSGDGHVGGGGGVNDSPPTMDYSGTYYSGYTEASSPVAAFDVTYSSSQGSSSAASSSLLGPGFLPETSTEGSAMGTNSSGGGGVMNGDASWYNPYSDKGFGGSTSNDYGSQQPYYYCPSTATDTMAATMMPTPVTQTVKIIVKCLSRHASHRELENFLYKAAGGRHKLQEPIRFPRSLKSKKPSASSYSSGHGSSYNNGDSNNASRQHAFLVFKDYDDANAALDRLETGRLRGIAVEARFVNETVLPLLELDSSEMYGYSSSSVNASGNATPTPGTVGAVGAVDANRTHSPALTAMSPSSEHSEHSEHSARSGQSDGGQSHNLVVDGSSAYGRAVKGNEGKPAHDHCKHRK